MNIRQRIVLMFGAVALVIVILTVPKIVIYQGTFLNAKNIQGEELAKVVDFRTGILRIIGVVAATLLVFYAFKNTRKKQHSDSDKAAKTLCQEQQEVDAEKKNNVEDENDQEFETWYIKRWEKVQRGKKIKYWSIVTPCWFIWLFGFIWLLTISKGVLLKALILIAMVSCYLLLVKLIKWLEKDYPHSINDLRG